jgi:hypothetical protein
LAVKLRRNHRSSYREALEPPVSCRFRELLHRDCVLCAVTYMGPHCNGGVI